MFVFLDWTPSTFFIKLFTILDNIFFLFDIRKFTDLWIMKFENLKLIIQFISRVMYFVRATADHIIIRGIADLEKLAQVAIKLLFLHVY